MPNSLSFLCKLNYEGCYLLSIQWLDKTGRRLKVMQKTGKETN